MRWESTLKNGMSRIKGVVPNRLKRDINSIWAHRKKQLLIYGGSAVLMLGVYTLSQGDPKQTYVYLSEGKSDFKDARVLGSQSESILNGKEKLFSKQMKDLLANQEELLARIDYLEKGKGTIPQKVIEPEVLGPPDPVRMSGTSDEYPIHTSRAHPDEVYPAAREVPPQTELPLLKRKGTRKPKMEEGEDIISFPVQDAAAPEAANVVLPLGSYVKAKLLTGVEAPEGRTYPVLLQLDYAYTLPGKSPYQKKLDMAGCFMIAKAEGDLSTERVQMQANKLSCVSKSGKMFEREVNGFIADDKDNSFSVIGNVNSKQDRVAAMAFLASIVEGIGKSISQAQVTQQGFPTGGGQQFVTGDQAKYIGGGAAANAAGLVTQWYLRQAQNLLPTINVGSGQDVWVVMKDSIKLPVEYFSNLGGSNGSYSYLSRVLD